MAFFSNLARKSIPSLKTLIAPTPSSIRTYISDMRQQAFKENLLRILRTKITYADESSSSPPPPPHPFSVEDRPGEQWVRLTRRISDAESVKIDATMIDGAVPGNPRVTDQAYPTNPPARLHISLIVEVSKGDRSGFVLQAVCSAWPEALDIQKVFPVSRGTRRPPYPFAGPDFGELDDELQCAVREYLEERGVNDELAEFLHRYVQTKDHRELIRWMRNVESYVKK